ncbi:MAG: hypothetical protein A2W08_07370 [Candidatus Rokubacteria bacterium RBG_16_73_20]|nr:MAG: hypothetical protein A2W08_07370 [Candidatus Rokubacteria bacterium RBG_16_73_20]
MPTLTLTLNRNGRTEPVRYEARRLINAGFTGRDRAAVEAHIEELRRHGVPCPDETPVLYPKMASLITTADEVEVIGPDTSGEAEFVLLLDAGRVLVGTGSDHTDRELEKTTIEKAKVVCPNVLSSEVWDLADVRKDWDDLVLRSWATSGGTRTLYQESRLAQMMTPEDLIALVKERAGAEPGLVIYSGTLALVGGTLICGERFEVELTDERHGRALRCSYRVRPIAGVKA